MTNQQQTSQRTGSDEIGIVEDDLRDLEVRDVEIRNTELLTYWAEGDYEKAKREMEMQDVATSRRYRRTLRIGTFAGLFVGVLGAGISYWGLRGFGATSEMASAVTVSVVAATAVLLAAFALGHLLSARLARG
jgi:hypothetical protein